MYDPKFAYYLGSPIIHSKTSKDGENESYTYKFRTTKKKPYFILVNVYDNNVHFIKFYPKRLQQSPNKYKKRVGNVDELTRIVSTCVKLALNIYSKNNDAIFGFHGQWDEKDVDRNDRNSQRYRIYKRAVISIIEVIKKEGYKFQYFDADTINTFFVIPNNFEEIQTKEKLKTQFLKLYGDDISKLEVPDSNIFLG